MKKYLKKISDSLVFYKSSGNYKYIREVEQHLRDYYLADGVVFYAYNMSGNTISLFSEKDSKVIGLEKSLVKQCIETKSPITVDHVNSNKFYNTDIDNPLNLKIKSMMIVPLLKNEKILGVVILYKDVKRRKVFLRNDETVFTNFSFVLLDVFSKISIKRTNNTHGYISDTVPIERRSQNERSRNKDEEKLIRLESEISKLKNNFVDVEVDNKLLKKELTALKVIKNKNLINNTKIEKLQEYSQKIDEQNKQIEKYENEIKQLNVEITSKSLEIINNNAYLEENNKLKDKVTSLQGEVTKLDNTKEKLKEYSRKLDEQNKQIEKYEKEIKKLDAKIASKPLIETNKNTYFEENNKLKEEVKYLNQEIKYLESEVKKLDKENEALLQLNENKESISLDINKQKHKEVWLQRKTERENMNIEYILLDADKMFGANRQAYMLFELMIFALSSDENMRILEEQLQASKIMLKTIKEIEFEDTLKIRKDKYLVTEFIDNIKSFESTILQSQIKFNIELDKFMPKYFIFDAPKVQSIVLNLLLDLQSFIDHNNPIDMRFTHNTKLLHIEIGGGIPQKAGGFLSGFTKKKPVKEISERPALQIGRKILNSFEYDITHKYTEKYYKFMLDVPII